MIYLDYSVVIKGLTRVCDLDFRMQGVHCLL